MAVVALPATRPALVADRPRPRVVAAWLFAVAALIFAMVVVGGITRLTESGLSIVRWNPVGGMVPPLNAAQWDATFAAYRATPQYQLVTHGMTLAAFKGIFFWEWLHRLLGMTIGLAFAVPLTAFVVLRGVPAGYGWRLAALLALGGLQGAIGWWMVASGLVDRPSVAPERLAVHLVNALILMSGCLWTGLDIVTARRRGVEPRPVVWIIPFAALLTIQIVWGAFTAGLRAGHAADTWPSMLGQIVPPLGSVVADAVTVQFVHRTLAYAVAAAALWVAFVAFGAGAGRRAAALASLVVLQFTLGVLTVVHGVPIALAAAHQATAALLVATTVWLAHWARR